MGPFGRSWVPLGGPWRPMVTFCGLFRFSWGLLGSLGGLLGSLGGLLGAPRPGADKMPKRAPRASKSRPRSARTYFRHLQQTLSFPANFTKSAPQEQPPRPQIVPRKHQEGSKKGPQAHTSYKSVHIDFLWGSWWASRRLLRGPPGALVGGSEGNRVHQSRATVRHRVLPCATVRYRA